MAAGHARALMAILPDEARSTRPHRRVPAGRAARSRPHDDDRRRSQRAQLMVDGQEQLHGSARPRRRRPGHPLGDAATLLAHLHILQPRYPPLPRHLHRYRARLRSATADVFDPTGRRHRAGSAHRGSSRGACDLVPSERRASAVAGSRFDAGSPWRSAASVTRPSDTPHEPAIHDLATTKARGRNSHLASIPPPRSTHHGQRGFALLGCTGVRPRRRRRRPGDGGGLRGARRGGLRRQPRRRAAARAHRPVVRARARRSSPPGC